MSRGHRRPAPRPQQQGNRHQGGNQRGPQGGNQGRGINDAGNQARIAQQVNPPRPRPRPEQLTPRQQYEADRSTHLAQEIDYTEARWMKLSDSQVVTWQMTRAQLEGSGQADQLPGPGEQNYIHQLGTDYYAWGVFPRDAQDPTTLDDMVGPDSTQFTSRAFVTDHTDADGNVVADRSDVTTLNNDGTTSLLESNEENMVELPEDGPGFTTHNRDDVRVNGRPQPDQWGTPEAIARNMNIFSDYETMFDGSTISVGDLSTDTGNSPRLETGGTSRHQTHYHGSQTDTQYVDGTGSTNHASTEADDLFRQRMMVSNAEDWGMDHFYASTRLRNQLYVGEGSSIGYNSQHDNHLHMGQGDGTR